MAKEKEGKPLEQRGTYMTPRKRREEALRVGRRGRRGERHEDAEALGGFMKRFGLHIADHGGVHAGVDHHDVDDGLPERLVFQSENRE